MGFNKPLVSTGGAFTAVAKIVQHSHLPWDGDEFAAHLFSADADKFRSGVVKNGSVKKRKESVSESL